MVYQFSVVLVRQSGWQLIVRNTHQFVDHCLEHDVEALDKQILALRGGHLDLICLVEEGVA